MSERAVREIGLPRPPDTCADKALRRVNQSVRAESGPRSRPSSSQSRARGGAGSEMSAGVAGGGTALRKHRYR